MRYVSIILSITVFCLISTLNVAVAQSLPTGMLPDGVMPVSYELDLHVTPEEKGFSGEVHIAVVIEKPTQLIWMHGQGLHVTESYVQSAGKNRIAASYSEIDDTGIVKLETATVVEPGDATIVIKYDGQLNQSVRGLYQSKSDGEHYVYTHLQPLSARKVFPGFDEPRFKTPITLSVNIPAADIAISNTAEIKTTPLPDNRKQVFFAQTKPIPNYLFALAIGEFDVVEWPSIKPNAIRARSIPLRGIAPKGKGSQFTFALKHTEAMMNILEEYFEIPYPYAKLDLVAPVAFSSGGMENVGAIFYRKNIILTDENPSIYQMRGLASIHAHELAHSWFGNLVTPEWWDDIWLNESFASWMAARVVHEWRPDIFNDRAPIRAGNWAKGTDQLVSARQIRQPVANNNDIVNAFDSITYSKGSNVLSMMERYMGEEDFKRGIRKFISANAHGVASADDFFNALSEVAKDPEVITSFRSFVEQPGTAKIAVNWACDARGQTEVTLKQSRSLPLGSKGDHDKNWSIPVCLAYPNGGQRDSSCLLMKEASETVLLPTKSCPAWIIPNADGAAYINYSLPEHGWDGLIDNRKLLNPGELLSAMHSMGKAYSAGSVSTAQVLSLAKVAALSPDWDVAEAPMQALREIKLFVVPKEQKAASKAIMRQIYQPALDKFDISDAALARDESDPNKALLRSNLIWFMALDAEDPALRKQLNKLAKAYMGFGTDDQLHTDQLHPNLVRTALTVAVHEEGIPFANALIKRLKLGTSYSLQSNIVAALGLQSSPEIRQLIWSMILDKSTPKTTASRLLRRQGRRSDNSEAILNWIRNNYAELLTRIPNSDHRWLVWRVSGMCNSKGRDEIEGFFADKVKTLRGAPRALANVLEKIEICSAVTEYQQPGAISAIKGYKKF